jgi:hypothetical protein
VCVVLQIVTISPDVKNICMIVKEVTKPVVLLFAVLGTLTIAFGMLHYELLGGSDEFGGKCDSFLECFSLTGYGVFQTDWMGWYQSATPGDDDGSNVKSTSSVMQSRMVLDIVENLLLNIMFWGFIGGLIVDNFGSMREDDNAHTESLETSAFVTGLALDEAGAAGISFSDHNDVDFFYMKYIEYVAAPPLLLLLLCYYRHTPAPLPILLRLPPAVHYYNYYYRDYY